MFTSFFLCLTLLVVHLDNLYKSIKHPRRISSHPSISSDPNSVFPHIAVLFETVFSVIFSLRSPLGLSLLHHFLLQLPSSSTLSPSSVGVDSLSRSAWNFGRLVYTGGVFIAENKKGRLIEPPFLCRTFEKFCVVCSSFEKLFFEILLYLCTYEHNQYSSSDNCITVKWIWIVCNDTNCNCSKSNIF